MNAVPVRFSAAWVLAPALVLAAAAYEGPRTFKASELLKPAQVKGPHYSVAPTVKTEGYLHVFDITTDYGPLEAEGHAMLLMRLHEVGAIAELAHARGLRVHMDGARFANAVASLEVPPAELTWRAGVDVLCFGGTKMGLPVGEAVVFFDRSLSEDFAWRCKQAGQLASKMRFLSAPWLGILDDAAWLRHARHANAMARRLAGGLAAIPGAELLFPVEANGVFVNLPAAVLDGLRERGWRFYTFIGAGGARFMCAWDTRPESVDALLADLRTLST